jgi:hypothetical protein
LGSRGPTGAGAVGAARGKGEAVRRPRGAEHGRRGLEVRDAGAIRDARSAQTDRSPQWDGLAVRRKREGVDGVGVGLLDAQRGRAVGDAPVSSRPRATARPGAARRAIREARASTRSGSRGSSTQPIRLRSHTRRVEAARLSRPR